MPIPGWSGHASGQIDERALGVGTSLGRGDAGPQARERLIVQAAGDPQRSQRSSRTATIRSGCGVLSRNLKSGGMMPTTCAGCESIES